jgi:hypothetical protein
VIRDRIDEGSAGRRSAGRRGAVLGHDQIGFSVSSPGA